MAVNTTAVRSAGGAFKRSAGGALTRLVGDFFDPNIDGAVWDLQIQSDGKILVGGNFTEVAGQTMNYMARLNASGTLDTSFADPDFDDLVFTLALQSDGKVYCGGAFQNIGATAVPYICRVTSGGVYDSGFTANLTGSSPYLASACRSDNKVLVGRWNPPASFIQDDFARMSVDGTREFSVNSPSSVHNVRVNDDNSYYFSSDTHMIYPYTSSDTTELPDWYQLQLRNGIGSAEAGYGDLHVFKKDAVKDSDGNYICCGHFITGSYYADGYPSGNIIILPAYIANKSMYIAKIFASTGLCDFTYLTGLYLDNRVCSVVLLASDSILCGGFFTDYNGTSVGRVAKFDSSGNLDITFNSNLGTGFNDSVHVIRKDTDGTFIVGGAFTSCNGYSRKGVCRLSSGGEVI